MNRLYKKDSVKFRVGRLEPKRDKTLVWTSGGCFCVAASEIRSSIVTSSFSFRLSKKTFSNPINSYLLFFF